MNYKSIIKKLERERDKIAKFRDTLRDVLDEFYALEESASNAVEELNNTIDSLSQYA